MSDIHETINRAVKDIRLECSEANRLNKPDSVYTSLSCLRHIESIARTFFNKIDDGKLNIVHQDAPPVSH